MFGFFSSVASSFRKPAVQNEIASGSLASFNRPIGVIVLSRAQDWRNRQKIDYEASKGLLKQDFLGLKDWKEQISSYSRTSLSLMMAYRLIRPLVTRNRHLMLSLIRNPWLGWVGRFLLKMQGMDRAFVAPESILKDGARLKKAVSG